MFKVEQLHFSFGQHKILNDLNLKFEKGKIYGILGKNGAGKTTFFRNLAGLLKPDEGIINYNDRNPRHIDISFLETHNYFYPYMRADEYLHLVVPQAEVDQLADVFNLPLQELVDEYSTGMKKKLAFMANVLQERPILLLDEPFNGVDLMSNEVIYQILEKIKSEKIILLSSHILQTLTQCCDEIIILKEGKIEKSVPRESFGKLELEIKNEIKSQIDQLSI